MAYHVHTTPGFIVGSQPSGEAGRFILIFTEALGMIGASAQGIRRLTSKLRYHTQDFSYAQFSVVRGKESWRLTGARELREIEHSNEGERECSLQAQEHYQKILTLLKRLVHGEERNSALFEIIRDGYSALQKYSSIHQDAFVQKGVMSATYADELFAIENLCTLRMLANLGYVARVPKLSFVIDPQSITQGMIQGAMIHKKIILHEINAALVETQL